MADPVHRPAGPGPARAGGPGEEGEAAAPGVRTGDRGVRAGARGPGVVGGTAPGGDLSRPPACPPAAVSAPFEPGERVLLVDDRGRRYLVRLQAGGSFHFHGGRVPHDSFLGSNEGVVVRSPLGIPLTCYRPTMADFILKMPRGAQVVYP